jgi:hypothetical protein
MVSLLVYRWPCSFHMYLAYKTLLVPARLVIYHGFVHLLPVQHFGFTMKVRNGISDEHQRLTYWFDCLIGNLLKLGETVVSIYYKDLVRNNAVMCRQNSSLEKIFCINLLLSLALSGVLELSLSGVLSISSSSKYLVLAPVLGVVIICPHRTGIGSNQRTTEIR